MISKRTRQPQKKSTSNSRSCRSKCGMKNTIQILNTTTVMLTNCSICVSAKKCHSTCGMFGSINKCTCNTVVKRNERPQSSGGPLINNLIPRKRAHHTPCALTQTHPNNNSYLCLSRRKTHSFSLLGVNYSIDKKINFLG